jgi:hypothetical protein
VGTGIIENARIRVRRLSVLWRNYAACADSIPRELTSDGNIRVQAVWPDRDCGSGERKPRSNRKTLFLLVSRERLEADVITGPA